MMASGSSEQLPGDHVKFVSNHTGTTVTEVLLVVALPQLALIFQVLLVMWPTRMNKNLISRFGVELLLVLLPQLALCTVLSDYTTEIGLTLVGISILLSLCIAIQSKNVASISAEEIQSQFSGTCHYLTTFRGGLLVLTAICILAVDFPVFPRRFAKAETFGYGLMDLGVGLFVVVHAIVSPEAKGICLPLKKRLLHVIQSSAALIVLGFSRILAVKSSGYHEHLSEGGPHWNFFFTLALTKVVATSLLMVINPRYSMAVAAVVISVYQDLLSRHGLSTILLEGDFTHYDGMWYYISANKGGLCSCIGYLSIYLTAVTLGQYLLTIKRSTTHDIWKLAVQLYLASAILSSILWISHNHVEPVSRRFANFTYVIWVISFAAITLATSIIGDLVAILIKQLQPVIILQRKTLQESKRECGHFMRLTDAAKGPLLFHAVNFNGLPYFLMANILTGIINLTVNTIHVETLTAVSILVFYVLLTSAIIIFVEFRNIKLKVQSPMR